MKRFLIFTALFPPLALLVYVTPMAVTEGFPELGFVFYMMGFAYMLALVPAWVAAGTDWALSAKPPYFRLVATMAVAAAMAHLIAGYLGDPMYLREIIYVALTGAIPAAICSLLANGRIGMLHRRS
jgi:hypothetical protein